MAKITRVLQKIFGSTAPSTELGQIGSLAAGLPTTTADPLVMQSLPNYLGGLNDLILGNNSPAIEDMNSLHFLASRQLAYLMQAGVAEYDATTEYYIGSLVNDAGVLYKSLTDTNVGNALTDETNWINAYPIDLRRAKFAALNDVEVPVLGQTAGLSNHLRFLNGIFLAGDSSSLTDDYLWGDGGTFTEKNDLPTNATWTDFAYGAGTYVAVGYSSAATSTDEANNFTTRTISANQFLTCAYGSGLFVAAGFNGENDTSPDGITWTNRPNLNGGTANFVSRYLIHDGSQFILAGGENAATDKKIATSPDGLTWSYQSIVGADTNPAGNNAFLQVTFGNGIYVAIGEDATIATSPDGITWTNQGDGVTLFGPPIPGAPAWWQGTGVQYGNGLFLIQFNSINLPLDFPTQGRRAVSEDGVNWTVINANNSDTNFTIAFGNGRFYYQGTGGLRASLSLGD